MDNSLPFQRPSPIEYLRPILLDLGYNPRHVSGIFIDTTSVHVTRALWDEKNDRPIFVKATHPITGEFEGGVQETTDIREYDRHLKTYGIKEDS